MQKKASRRAVARRRREQEIKRREAKERREHRAIAAMERQAERAPAVRHHGRDVSLPRPRLPVMGMIFPDPFGALLLFDLLSLFGPPSRHPRTIDESLAQDRRALESDRARAAKDFDDILGLRPRLIEHK
jgi:hypothetical protein